MNLRAARAMARLDVRTVAPYRSQLLILLSAMAILAVLIREPSVAGITTVTMAVTAASYPFSIGERNDLDTLFGMLPVRRGDVVAGRYLFALGVFAVAVVIGCGSAAASAAVTGQRFGAGDLAVLVGVSLVVFAVFIGGQYPLYFALGYQRARLMAVLPGLALGIAGALVVIASPDWLSAPVRTSPVVVTVGSLALGIVLLASSAGLSYRLDARRTR